MPAETTIAAFGIAVFGVATFGHDEVPLVPDPHLRVVTPGAAVAVTTGPSDLIVVTR